MIEIAGENMFENEIALDIDSAVITGPTGVVGVALVRKLLENGTRVAAVCRPGSKRIDNLPNDTQLETVELPLSELMNLPYILKGRGFTEANAFFHLGWDASFGIDARNDLTLQMENAQRSVEAVEVAAALGCEVFVGTGSQAEYGRFDGVLTSDTPTRPENGYGAAKLSACHMTRLRCGQLGIRQCWTRILSVYGPCELPGTVISSTIGSLLTGGVPKLTPCEQIWDFLYCDDAARALIAVARKGKPGAIYVLGSGEERQLREYIEELRDAINPAAELAFGALPYNAQQVMQLRADINPLVQDTTFKPTVSFENGIRETIEWHKARIAR